MKINYLQIYTSLYSVYENSCYTKQEITYIFKTQLSEANMIN